MKNHYITSLLQQISRLKRTLYIISKVVIIGLMVTIPCIGNISIRPISDHIAIKITAFPNQNFDQNVYKELLNYKKKPSIIIDLRNNNGGYLYESLKFAALFVTENNLIEMESETTSTMVTRPENHPFIETKKLIILTNSQTASAAEAACIILSKHPNSIIIGTNTQGKSEIKTSPSKIVKHTHFYIPNHHISPDIFKRFDSKLDNESVYLESIKLSNQFQKEYDSTIKPRLTSGN